MSTELLSEAFVSVVVPVYRDEGRLESCLHSLEAQSWPVERFEVIVVDNGDSSELATRVEGFPHVRLVAESRPGSFAARNRGVSAARGDVLAFIDADCIAASEWIQGGVETLQALGPGVVGGEVDMFVENPARTTVWDLHDLAWGVPQRDLVTRLQCAATANAFTTRAVFDAVGGFDPELLSGGDREFGIRTLRAGYRLGLAEKARVRHPTRSSFAEFLSRRRRITGGLLRLKTLLDSRYPGHDYQVPGRVRDSLWRAFVRDPGHPDVRRPWNRLRFRVAEAALLLIMLVESSRLKIGGKPVRR